MNKTVRWHQRFRNLEKVFGQLGKGLALANPTDIEKQGIIQSFEFTFELAWKTLKDYLESQQVAAQFPRDVIKQAFHYQIITNGDVWMDMLDKRNAMAHTYDEAAANRAISLIAQQYYPALQQGINFLQGKPAQ